MSLQRIQGAFRTSNGSVGSYGAPTNLVDPIFSPFTNPAWTPGSTLIDGIQLTAPANQQWSLQQITVYALLVLRIFPSGPPGGPIYGKLGKILAGLGTLLTPTNGPPGLSGDAFANGVQLPADRTAIGTLWDPATDPLPPFYNNPTTPTFLPVSTTITPSFPLPVDQGEALGIGLWMLPSLLGQYAPVNNWQLVIAAGGWAITYDDGVTPPNYT